MTHTHTHTRIHLYLAVSSLSALPPHLTQLSVCVCISAHACECCRHQVIQSASIRKCWNAINLLKVESHEELLLIHMIFVYVCVCVSVRVYDQKLFNSVNIRNFFFSCEIWTFYCSLEWVKLLIRKYTHCFASSDWFNLFYLCFIGNK